MRKWSEDGLDRLDRTGHAHAFMYGMILTVRYWSCTVCMYYMYVQDRGEGKPSHIARSHRSICSMTDASGLRPRAMTETLDPVVFLPAQSSRAYGRRPGPGDTRESPNIVSAPIGPSRGDFPTPVGPQGGKESRRGMIRRLSRQVDVSSPVMPHRTVMAWDRMDGYRWMGTFSSHDVPSWLMSLSAMTDDDRE
jgi:hypothetical protein